MTKIDLKIELEIDLKIGLMIDNSGLNMLFSDLSNKIADFYA